MIAEGFGILHLDSVAPEMVAAQTSWLGCKANAIVLTVSLVLFIINFNQFIHLLPEALSCLLRSNPNIGLEHNLHSSKERTTTAWILMPFFLIVADRYHLYNPSFIEWLPYGWSLISLFPIILLFIASRYIFYPLRPKGLSGDVSKAAHNTLYTCFIGMMCIVIPTACITLVFHAPDNVAGTIILLEIGLFFSISAIRTAQFLSRQCSVFSTFLYLCALELIPTALIVVSDRLL